MILFRYCAITLLAGVCLVSALAQSSETDRFEWNKARTFWAFRPPLAHNLPKVKNSKWPRQPLDYFILARLEAKSLSPSPTADRRTFIRRITFDLTGLPPAPEDVDTFLSDRSTNAYEKLVDRLLASPRFGERMASMWLPLARYAEDQAHQVGSDTKFFYPNAYKYREWVIDSFNRDLPYDRFIRLQLAADRVETSDKTQLAALGFVGLGPKYYSRNRLDVMADEWEDRVDTVTRTFLGLTVACARCHDHKYDPIQTEDYYALAGIFASTKMVNKTPEGAEEKPMAEAPQMSKDTLHTVEDDSPRDLNIFIRGNVDRKGPVVQRRFLRVLCSGDAKPFQEGSGRRELAEAIADRHNPLTARVMVNRLWGLFFGRPLVGTPSNFGAFGERPTHSELLDDLAVRFMSGGWSVKKIVREIVLSSTYRQGSRFGVQGSAKGRLADPENRLLSRMNLRRLTVEQWRDALLYVSGQLDSAGGPSLELSDAANRRRTVYARVSRLELNNFLMNFDYPDANIHAEKRSVTTTPMQKLFMLNSPFVVNQAKALAARLTANANEPNTARVRNAYRMLFAREPDANELRLATDFLSKPPTGDMSRWEQYAQMLLVSNELLYVD